MSITLIPPGAHSRLRMENRELSFHLRRLNGVMSKMAADLAEQRRRSAALERENLRLRARIATWTYAATLEQRVSREQRNA